jgi:hypothetical protein
MLAKRITMNAAWIDYVLFCAAMGIEPTAWKRSGKPDFPSQRTGAERVAEFSRDSLNVTLVKIMAIIMEHITELRRQAEDACLIRVSTHTVGIVNSIRTVGFDPLTKRRGDGEEWEPLVQGAGADTISFLQRIM